MVDPRRSGHLVAATTNGAFASDDGGVNWRLLHRRWTWDVSLAYHGDEREVLLATQQGLFRLTGDELSPVPLSRLVLTVSGLMDLARERLAVTHIPADPGQAFAFAGVRGRALLWYRSAVDRPFVPVPLTSLPIPRYMDDILDVGQASYDWYVACPPDTPDVVYLGAKEVVKGERSGGAWRWSDVSSRAATGDSIHPDQHTLAFDVRVPKVIYAGNDGGVFRSPDAGATWQSLNAGLAISEVEYLTQRPDDPHGSSPAFRTTERSAATPTATGNRSPRVTAATARPTPSTRTSATTRTTTCRFCGPSRAAIRTPTRRSHASGRRWPRPTRGLPASSNCSIRRSR